MYGGKFITLMETLSEDPLWTELAMFGQADIRRMKDVEYISTLFVLTMKGIQDGDELDDPYAKYDEEIPDVGVHLDLYNTIKGMIVQMHDTVRNTRFRNRGDFYSLWSALLQLASRTESIDYEQTSLRLRQFGELVDEVPDFEYDDQGDQDAVAYSQAVRAGTTKLPNRTKRQEILLKYIATK